MEFGKRYRISVTLLLILFFSGYYILPAVSMSFNLIQALLICFCYVFLTVFQNGMKLSKNIAKYIVLSIYISLLYIVLTDSAVISSTVTNLGMKRFISEFYQLSMMFLPLLFLKWTIQRATKFEVKVIVVISYFMIAFVLLKTMQELLINPNITKHWADFSETSTDNIGNYYFVYAIPFIVVFCTMILCKTKKVLMKFLMIALIIYQMYFLLLAQYTLSVIISVIGICLMVFFASGGGHKKAIIMLIFLVFTFMLPSIIKFSAMHVPSEQMSIRLNEIYDFLIGGDSMGYNLNSRMEIYQGTLKDFLRSPIWGNRQLSVNGHSTFLNVLGYLGLIGGIPFYYLYFHSKKIVGKLINEKNREFMPFFIILLLTGFTNPIHVALPVMYVVWFLVPISIKLYNK